MKVFVFTALFIAISTLIFAEVGTIQSISFAADQGELMIVIKGEGQLDCLKSYADNPPRITLDFPDVKNKAPKKLEAKDNAFISKITTSKYSKDKKDYAQVVVEMKAPWNYAINKSDAGITLKLTPADAKKSASVPSKPSAPPPAVDLVIGSEDLLDVSVFELPQFNVTARVSGDGTITMPLVGSVEVRGLTKKQAEKKIADSLEAKYVNNANVSVSIKEYKSRQVSLLGAIKNPGAYYIISQRSLLQLLSEAGGLTADSGTKCFIFRPNSPRIEIDLTDLMVNGNQDLNVNIYPGDVINIPPQTKIVVYVLGAVRSPGAVEMTTSMPITLLAAIARAGGPADQANQSGIQIRRRDETGKENVIKANLKDIISGKAEDIQLLPGDVINVPESFF